jgi:hemerythrin superfamily protein
MQNPIESAMAKVAGMTAALDARFKGFKGVFTVLAAQHHQVDVLLLSLRSTDDVEKREQLWQKIRREIISHEQAELTEIYPVLARHAATGDIAEQHANHCADLERLVCQLDLVGLRSDAWPAALARLTAKVHEHVEAEESVFFPRAQAALGVTLSKQLERPFLRAKELAEHRLLA